MFWSQVSQPPPQAISYDDDLLIPIISNQKDDANSTTPV
jgi:hypothetical protein